MNTAVKKRTEPLLVFGPALDKAQDYLALASKQRAHLDFDPPCVYGFAPEKLTEIGDACTKAREALQAVISALLVADVEAKRMAEAVKAEQHKQATEA